VTRRNPFIDLLRGISILAVMSMHFIAQFGFPSWVEAAAPLKRVLESSYYGVTVFFVISGYLIATTSMKRFGKLSEIDLVQFAVFRVGRIVPLLLLVLALLVSLSLQRAFGFAFSKGDSVLAATASVLSLQSNDWLLHHGADPHTQAWTVMWSLSIEEIFYLIFPIACRTLRSHALLVGWLLLSLPFALYARAADVNALYGFRGCVDALAVGVLTSVLVDRARSGARPVLAVLGMLSALGALFWVAQHKLPSKNPQCGPLVCAIAAGLFIFSSTRLPATFGQGARRSVHIAGYALGLPFVLLGGLGQASYEGYLLHMPILRLAKNYLAVGAHPAMLIVLIGIGSFLVNRVFTEPVNRLVRHRLLVGGRQPAGHLSLNPAYPVFASLVLLAIPNIVVRWDTRHASTVVAASVKIRRASLGRAVIPLVAYGESGDADFVSVVKLDDGSIAVQYDHWGSASVVKAVPPALLKGDLFTVTLDCRAPAVLVEGEPVLDRDDLVGFSGHDAIAIGRNDIGGTTMAMAASAEVDSSTLTFNNGSKSDARTWKREE
jgi:peptidoglycan/LPS O-acetylase OafA/YrhL